MSDIVAEALRTPPRKKLTTLQQLFEDRVRSHVSPLSFAQQRLWFLDQLEPENSFYNVFKAIRLSGTLNVGLLQKAIDAIVAAIRLSRAGLRTPNKPVGSFLFFGPTGVGKTELARTLASGLSCN